MNNPFVMADLLGSLVLFLISGYLFWADRKRYLLIWGLSWSAYTLLSFSELFLATRTLFPLSLLGVQFFYILNGLLFLWGTYAFFNKKVPYLWFYGAALAVSWALYIYLTKNYSSSLYIPISLLSGVYRIWAGVLFWYSKARKDLSKQLVGWCLVFWGLTVITLPLVYSRTWLTPLGHIVTLALALVVGFGVLLTYFQNLMEKLITSENRFRLLAENAQDMIYRIKVFPKPEFEYLNPVVEKITGYSPEELYADPRPGLALIYYNNQPLLEIFKELPEPSTLPSVVNVSHKDGSFIWLEQQNVLIYDNHQKLVAIEGITRDITERKQIEEQILYLSYHDKLTGLYNRAFFEEELERLDTHRQLPISLIMGDLNGLKLVNNAFGHHEGDQLLIKISEILHNACRQEDIIARWGGDEFLILLPRTEEHHAAEICRRITQGCNNVKANPVPMSIALGTATKNVATQSIEEVLKEANNRMFRHKLLENKSTRNNILQSLQKTLEIRSYETEEHARRLQQMATQVGCMVGLTDSEGDELTLLAALHDIGKIAIPDEILLKPSSLSPEELKTIRKHPEIGYRIAQSFFEIAQIADAILAHHERWDGTGYPHGLKGIDIPVTARVIAIVDSYDVMTHNRPYRKAMSHQDALVELRRCAGSQFDPELVDMFIRMMETEDEELEAAATDEDE